MKINKNKVWIKGESYQKRILVDSLKDKIDLIEDVIIKPHGKVPLHAHKFTDEIFYITQNKTVMIVNNKEFKVKPGDFIQVFKGESHGFKNDSDKPLKLICFKLNFKKGDSYLK